MEDDEVRLKYLREMVTSSDMELRTCEILHAKPLLWDAAPAIDFQMTLHPDLRRLSPEEKRLLKEDVNQYPEDV
ncbi:hypothetical protein MTO96_038720 [Rhipicephalus appendiculatus]